ncbi:MAG: glycosyltransferase family 4 protein [Chitinispirillaceae bacterium]|nr:glycosyltransferase family 4 protein [Chitinispirillaceae bacterium]
MLGGHTIASFIYNDNRNMTMHILFLSHYFPPEVNAPASRTYDHCKRWVAEGCEVTVVTCFPNCPEGVIYKGYRKSFRSMETIDGITLLRVWTYIAPNKGFLKRICNYISYMISSLLHCITMRRIDLIIATSPQFFCGWAGVLLHWFRKWPFILEIRDIWPESIVTVGAMKKSLFIRFLERLELMMYRSADHIVTVGEGYRQRIVDKGIAGDRISVVINGVDLERFKPFPEAPFTRKKYHGEGRFVCSYIGTVGMAHGLEVILKAAKICKDTGCRDTLFWIVGDGAQRADLERGSREHGLNNIIFTGRLPKEEMPEIITASDCCLVHLRKSELFGTVIPSKIFELMAMNIPIIMAVRGEAQDIVMQGNAGVVMEPDDPRSLLRCINIIREKGRGSFSGREYVGRYYNRDVLALKMLSIIKKYAKNNQ